MEITIINHHKGFQEENITNIIRTKHEIRKIKEAIISDFLKRKSEIISMGIPYREVKEGPFYCFKANSFQFIQSECVMDITYGDEHIQYLFPVSSWDESETETKK